MIYCKTSGIKIRVSVMSIYICHIEDLSLCTLLSAAKKTDQEFGSHRTTAHSTRDAKTDIDKKVNALHENKVTHLVEGQLSKIPLKTG